MPVARNTPSFSQLNIKNEMIHLYLASPPLSPSTVTTRSSGGFLCKLPYKLKFEENKKFEIGVVEASLSGQWCNVFDAYIEYNPFPLGGTDWITYKLPDGLYPNFHSVVEALDNFSSEINFTLEQSSIVDISRAGGQSDHGGDYYVNVSFPKEADLKMSRFFFRCLEQEKEDNSSLYGPLVVKGPSARFRFNSNYWDKDILFLEAPNWIETCIVNEFERPVLSCFSPRITPGAPSSDTVLSTSSPISDVQFKEIRISEMDRVYFEIRNWSGRPIRFLKRMCCLHLVIRAKRSI